jgi:membrane dipeptidase
VGISSDFNHGCMTVWDNEGEAQNVTAELIRHGHTESEIAKLWGGNFSAGLGRSSKCREETGRLRTSFQQTSSSCLTS